MSVVAVGGGGGEPKVARPLLVLCRLFPSAFPTRPPLPGPRDFVSANPWTPPQTLFSFEADATALVPEVFSLGFEDEYEELEADLQEFSEKFADSPAAQVGLLVRSSRVVDGCQHSISTLAPLFECWFHFSLFFFVYTLSLKAYSRSRLGGTAASEWWVWPVCQDSSAHAEEVCVL